MMLHRTATRLVAAIVLATAAQAAAPAHAQSVADFYSGNRIVMIVAAPAGGGYDQNARTLGRYLGHHIPGAPTIVVQNMPGADGIIAANNVYNVAPQDGTVIGVGTRTTAFAPLFGLAGARYDVSRIAWLGSSASETGVAVAWHTAPVKTAADLFKTELVIGAGSTGGDFYVFPYVLNHLLGTKFKIVGGYSGLASIGLAMERGEIQGVGNYTWTTLKFQHPDWISEKTVALLLQFGLARHADLPDVPLAMDFAKTDEQRQLLAIFMRMKTFGFPFFVGPNVPADRVTTLRAAFEATMRDPDFVAETRRQKREVSPSSGETMQAALSETYALPAALLAKARALMPQKK
jgi:tripartite-type tricarboxylate transporter receptor subunit TctC